MKYDRQQAVKKLTGDYFDGKDYKGPLLYHNHFYRIKNTQIIMGGLIMEIILKRIGPGMFSWYKTIIDDDTIDIDFPPENSVVLFKEKKQK